MILKDLVNCYDLISDYNKKYSSDKFKLDSLDYSFEDISFEFIISEDGLIKAIYEKKEVKKVPIHINRSSDIIARLLCDSSKYIMGYDKFKKTEECKRCFNESKKLHNKVLGGVENKGFKAVLNFFNRTEENLKIALYMEPKSLKGGNIIFKLEGENKYIHDYEDVKNRIHLYKGFIKRDSNMVKGMCSISGEDNVPISRIHRKINIIGGSKKFKSSIVSFNEEAFKSYNKIQSYNASVSETSMFKYTSALNALLKNENNHTYLNENDNTIVFWSDKIGCLEDVVIGAYMKEDSIEKEYNQRGTNEMVSIIENIKRGMTVNVDEIQDNSINVYILVFSPSKARIFVRFWFKNSLKEFVKLSNKHFEDTKLIRKMWNNKSKTEEFGVKISSILKSVASNVINKNGLNTLNNNLFKSILTGSIYPVGLYNNILLRIRAEAKEKISVNHTRVSFIKGYLKRYYRLKGLKDKEEEVTVALNLNSSSTGYNLGRVFAILEKIQDDANKSSNVREKYLSIASSTPRNIFPFLLNLSQHHISKINKENNRSFNYYDKMIGSVLMNIDEFPSILTSDEQGMFMLGYYHQREDIFTKKEVKKDVEGN